jgi:hypothetical protein
MGISKTPNTKHQTKKIIKKGSSSTEVQARIQTGAKCYYYWIALLGLPYLVGSG